MQDYKKQLYLSIINKLLFLNHKGLNHSHEKISFSHKV